MAGNNDVKLETADKLLRRIQASAENYGTPQDLERLANAFALVAGATGGRDKSQGRGSVVM